MLLTPIRISHFVFFALIMFFVQPAYAVVGGQLVSNSSMNKKVWQLTKCQKITSIKSGAYYGCEDLAIATGSFIKSNQILTAGHFAAHFLFNPEDHFLKIRSEDEEFLLRYKKDFFIRMPKEYYQYEKKTRFGGMKKKDSAEVCSYDIAVIVFTKSMKQKMNSKIETLALETKQKPQYCQPVKMYGYGAYQSKIYLKKTFKAIPNLSHLVAPKNLFAKKWSIKNKHDGKLRLGNNILKPATESFLGVKNASQKDFGLDSMKTLIKEADYYTSYMSSGDSGGPIISNDKIIGITCSINSVNELNGDISVVNLITPTYTEKLSSFWNRIKGEI